ncbi:extensin family protein [Aliiroseovarius crassostreae]|uniref:Extensin family protein n=1 Tax=Aliiroseovarius crassostreae TaxID=154981 RepID=A0A0P7JR04_9RHOB|nr:extensin family protein [Aliiroseovarius crassostreae]
MPQSTGTFGAICGSRRIRGQKVSTISGTLPGCGLRGGVKVSEVSGIRLSTPAVMDCDTAKALDSWVRKGVVPAVGRLGGGPAELKVIAHYACRTRNNKPGGKVSEHGKGKAVDIAGLTLKNGARISVLKGWKDPVQGKVLRAMHASACGPFGTVLGPDADRYHKDHLHLDTARYRSGSYCR